MIGYTALMDAAWKGHVKCIEILIERGAGVNFIDVTWRKRRNWTGSALMCTTEGGHMDCVNTLVKAGADVNIRTINDQTALIYAVENEDKKVLNFLLK